MANMFINAMTDVWASSGTTFSAIKMAVTDTASAAGSKLIDLKGGATGSTDLFSVDKAGNVAAAGHLAATGGLTPVASDGAALGSTTLRWSDLYGASGFTINLAGDWIGTHSTGILTVSTGDLRVTTAGTNAASVVTVGGTQTLTGKTLTTPTINGATLTGTVTGNGAFTGGVSGTTGTFSGLITTASTTGTIAAVTSAQGIQVIGAGGGNAAFITFHRPGAYAAAFGLDSDNVLKFGGWSAGATSYTVYHSGSSTIASVGSVTADAGNMIMAGGLGSGRVLSFQSGYYLDFSTSTGVLRYVMGGGEVCHFGTTGITSSTRVWSETGYFVSTTTSVQLCATGTSGAGTVYLRPRGADNSTFEARVSSISGVFSCVSVSEYSDDTLKKNWVPTDKSVVDEIANLEIGSFKWKETDTDGYGVKAQALRNIMPDAVHEDENGLLGVNYGKAALTAIIDASKRILALEARIAELEGKG